MIVHLTLVISIDGDGCFDSGWLHIFPLCIHSRFVGRWIIDTHCVSASFVAQGHDLSTAQVFGCFPNNLRKMTIDPLVVFSILPIVIHYLVVPQVHWLPTRDVRSRLALSPMKTANTSQKTSIQNIGAMIINKSMNNHLLLSVGKIWTMFKIFEIAFRHLNRPSPRKRIQLVACKTEKILIKNFIPNHRIEMRRTVLLSLRGGI